MARVGSVHAPIRWSSRIVPLILLALAVIAVYVITDRICIKILIPMQQEGAAIAILVLLFFSLSLGLICYFRTFITIAFNPGAVPLPPAPDRTRSNRHTRNSTGVSTEEARSSTANRLEQFWTKDVFQCNDQGDFRWCSACKNWKPDRSHHSKELQRCIRKMDHYCPWMGGMVSETSFKFFIQFNLYATFFTALCMSVGAYILNLEIKSDIPVDPWIVLIVVLGGFFGLFCCTLGTNSMRLAYLNLTSVDVIDYKVKTYHLAIRVSRNVAPSSDYKLISLPTPEASIDAGINTFAVVQTREGEHPWDLGYYRNWKSIMGNNIVDWLLPIRSSPELSYESHVSEYPVGPLYETLRLRYNLGTLAKHNER